MKALSFLCQSRTDLVSSSSSGVRMGVTGKPLGGIFSSLARQKINNQSLLIPFGQGDEGRGLRWKLNTSVISLANLQKMVEELLWSWGESK